MAKGFDMFPLTPEIPKIGGYVLFAVFAYRQKKHDINFISSCHVETVCLLERVSNRKPDAIVHIDVDMEDYYRIKESKKRSAEENKE